MKAEEKIPEGYEVQRDMMGFPYLAPKPDKRVPGWVKLVFAILVFVICITCTVPVLDFIFGLL